MGTVVLTAQTDGAGRPAECGRIWRLALLNGAAFGSLFGLLLLPGEAILLALGQRSEISAHGGAVLVMFALGMPAILMFTATTFFLEGIGRPSPGMVVMGLANLVNFGLNYVLMFGPWHMGATGAALATSITRWFMFLALAGYVLAMRDRRRYGIGGPMAGHWHLERKLAGLGWPIAVSYGLENGAFFAAATFAGWLGAVPLAGYQIVLNVMALIYMLAIGIATATAVRVGNAGRPTRPCGSGAGRLGRTRPRHRGHARPDPGAVRLERGDRPDLHRRTGGGRDRRPGAGPGCLDPAGRRQPGHPDRRAARRG
jgi:MATE family multidrug resistance protein